MTGDSGGQRVGLSAQRVRVRFRSDREPDVVFGIIKIPEDLDGLETVLGGKKDRFGTALEGSGRVGKSCPLLGGLVEQATRAVR